MSVLAKQAHHLVNELQAHFVAGLELVADDSFERAVWSRMGGRCGGGSRWFCPGNATFNRASVNVSHVHYTDLPEKKLSSATALSCIVHPNNPHAPSMHMHISWTEMKQSESGYWRIMADLNPSIEKRHDTLAFLATLEHAAPADFEEATQQGERYFYIPALQRHRGAAHFYLEQFSTGRPEIDLQLADQFGRAVIDDYLAILRDRIAEPVNPVDETTQLAYHSLYFLQVLTLDRGTTSGLLVHNENDLGIMGSLPARVNPDLLASWRKLLPSPQDDLLDGLLGCLSADGTVNDDVRLKLAEVLRQHYQKHPDALALQASGNIIPPTVMNHR